ncbi:YqaJ-like recombinase protein [Cupriavidus metallidurans]|uniref:lambda exonuclease family protein n=1 Tax=Cupriavidus metallidurans TaxID=119219 RepID=UPI0004939DD6|nr:lambda exonuclease family protein [Cupriavidus metallidurans]MDE4918321.1 YqaJ viral recombinase family protein [Cupriavidus metallidurans]
MKIVTCIQGDATWIASRAGVCTASMFRVARSRKKNSNERTDAALDYAFRLAIEILSGEPLDGGHETWQMRRGSELEADARVAHQADIGVYVQPVGMVLSDDGKFGASADGWIGADGGAEYKCLISPAELRTTLIGHDLAKYMDQVQGNLWLSGRRYWDFGIYCPALKAIGKDFFRWRIKRDDDYIDAMVEDLLEFDQLVESNVAELRKLAA